VTSLHPIYVVFVCVLVTLVCCAITAERIEMPFGADSCGLKNHVLGGVEIPHGTGQFWEGWKEFGASVAVYAAKWIMQSAITAWHAMLGCGLPSKSFDRLSWFNVDI